MTRTDEEKFMSVTGCPVLKNRVIRFAVTILPLFLLLYFAGSALAEGVAAELGKRIPPRPIVEVSTILPNWFPIMVHGAFRAGKNQEGGLPGGIPRRKADALDRHQSDL